ncbi:MAG: hypothetical protein ACK5MP_06740 [Nostocoides sp.]
MAVGFGTGLLGSLVGGLIGSLMNDDGSALRPSGTIGSIVGAVIVTSGYRWWKGRTAELA